MNILLDQACEAAQSLSKRDGSMRWVVGDNSNGYIVVRSLDASEAKGLAVWACYENGKYIRLGEEP